MGALRICAWAVLATAALALTFFVVSCLIALVLISQGFAHEAGGHVAQFGTPAASPPSGKQPMGWQYGWECCSGMDCAMIDSKDVHETSAGYVIDGSADTAPIPYGSKQIKMSKDQDFHWCAHRSGPSVNKTICIYVPPPSG